MSEIEEKGTTQFGIGDVTLAVGDHVAHFYRGEDEMFGVLGPYVATGIERGERCVVVSSPNSAEGLHRWLAENGINPAGAQIDGRLHFYPGQATASSMREMFEELNAQARTDGYGFVRLAGDASWALDGEASPSEMLRWEALYDELCGTWEIFALCQFDLSRTGGDVVIDALRSHPLTVVGEAVHRNPFHTDPETLLHELDGRT